MKVRITKKVSSFLYNGISYKPGEVISDLEDRLFRNDFMEAVVDVPVASVPEVVTESKEEVEKTESLEKPVSPIVRRKPRQLPEES